MRGLTLSLVGVFLYSVTNVLISSLMPDILPGLLSVVLLLGTQRCQQAQRLTDRYL
jgi:hypothetical protein